MRWNILAEPNFRRDQDATKVKNYKYIGKLVSDKDTDETEFRFWEKDGQLYAELLNDCNPNYFIPVSDLDSALADIETTYMVEHDSVSSLPVIEALKKGMKRGVDYERYDPDIDEESFEDMFIGGVKTIQDLEMLMLSDKSLSIMPIRIPSGEYITDKEYPILGVYETRLSRCIVELYVFNRDRNEDGYIPVFCRVVYNKFIPIDLKKFIDTNKKCELDDYIKQAEQEGKHTHVVRILHTLRDHQLEKYVEKHLEHFTK